MSSPTDALPEIGGEEKGIWAAAERSEKAGLRHAKLLRLVNNGEVKGAGAARRPRANTSASAGLGADIRNGGFPQIVLKNSDFRIDHNSEDRWRPR